MARRCCEADIRSRYEACGQGHVFQFLDNELSDDEKDEFLLQLEKITVDQLAGLLQSAARAAEASASSSCEDEDIQPFSGAIGRVTNTNDEKILVKENNPYYQTGMEAISKGQVAAVVLAGGQGTRLGFDGPKGMYDLGLPSGRTLFQLMAERIKKLSQLAAVGEGGDSSNVVMIPFYIMTSPLNHKVTVAYFESNNYFGLGADNVFFFEQGMLPCLTEQDGKIIMESKHKVAMAPDGNGGIYSSLYTSGALDDMTSRGIRYLHVFSIDNALVKPADPIFMGYCISEKADCGNKVVWKAHAHEKVGVIASKAGRPCVVEYSEITHEMAERTDDEKGMLLFGAANICNHFYTVDFIRDTILPSMGNLYHIARKKIPYYDSERKETVTPTSNNGIKLETFIFDVFPLSKRMAILDVNRTEEFAPVKNKAGSDSPDTAREMISSLCKKWVSEAGGKLTGDVETSSSICEIAPSTSYSGEGLEEIVKGKDVTCPFSL